MSKKINTHELCNNVFNVGEILDTVDFGKLEICAAVNGIDKADNTCDQGCVFDGVDGCTMNKFKCLERDRGVGNGVWVKKLS